MKTKITILLLVLISISVQQAQARYYQPANGRFLQEDPVFSTNVYIYAVNNPVLFTDPFGRRKLFEQEKMFFQLLFKESWIWM